MGNCVKLTDHILLHNPLPPPRLFAEDTMARPAPAPNRGPPCKFIPRKTLEIVYMTGKGEPMARIDQSEDWRNRHAPTISTFESLALEAYGHLPEEFRALTGNLIIEIAEFPSDDVFEDMALETPFDLLGLFEGRGISERFTVETGEMPNRITLYRRPILDYWAENEETLGDIVTHVLIHEIGHHFGLSDDDMERIEASAEIAAG
jgi:predicted Zn-dependent protease with MMP-like domain